jgi:hypothetical protein
VAVAAVTWSIDEQVIVSLAEAKGHDLQPWKPFVSSEGRAQCVWCERIYSVRRRALAARGEAGWNYDMGGGRPQDFGSCKGRPY